MQELSELDGSGAGVPPATPAVSPSPPASPAR
jgi:hypothetical protein